MRTSSGSGKDKRLLVLLAFGALIVLFRQGEYLIPLKQGDNRWVWFETEGENNRIHRLTLPLNGRPEEYSAAMLDLATAEAVARPGFDTVFAGVKAAALRVGGNGEASTAVSPRLSFLLGLPFPINHANEEELTMLPGIGPVLAARIADYRESRGAFSDIGDLRSVRGIGRRLAARLSPFLTFEHE
ncbi:MAG TPA: helix-hairpin-helix domain-containing protein [Desulfobacteraceae bacterium]|nr:helix-hairpin-helix domain-containing protein [Desulfobacteraceae bacterium]